MPTLDWIGKAAVVNHHRKVPYHLLRCDKELSAGDPKLANYCRYCVSKRLVEEGFEFNYPSAASALQKQFSPRE
jgi:DNA-directed RNA polymerase subunit RPC12/RpoP